MQRRAGRTRRPLLRFALLGAALFCGELALRALTPAAPALLPLPSLQGGVDGPTGVDGRDEAPGAGERYDAAWFEEALRLGLHRSDFIVQQRLARNMRFVNPDDTRSDEALAVEAIALGMHQSDLVVRRRLVQKMQLRIHEAVRRTPPSEAELRAYWEQNGRLFMQPERVRISQLYFRERGRAEAALAALQRNTSQGGAQRQIAGQAVPQQGGVQQGAPKQATLRGAAQQQAPPPGGVLQAEGGAKMQTEQALPQRGDATPTVRGDPLPLPRDLPLHARRELAQRFGPDFADAAFAAAPGKWLGPARGSYGFHLLFVHERRPARPADFESVRSALREALLFERGEAAVAEAARALVERRASPGSPGAADSAGAAGAPPAPGGGEAPE